MEDKINSIVCFGEILWDVLPTATLPGGAPMNVAYHLKKLGNEPAIISRIGNDELGRKLIELFTDNNINCANIQTDEKLQTGKVNAFIGRNNEVTYDIIKPVAWDNICWQANFESLVGNADYFVFGSLASRSTVSQNTLFKLLEMAKYKVFDVNLRAPHYNKEIVEKLLPDVRLLKLNEDELIIVSDWFADVKTEEERINMLQNKFNISFIVVTKGSEGAVLNYEGKFYNHNSYKVNVADTVGAGDCFLAALITKLSLMESPENSLRYACAAGALIAGYSGACPNYRISQIDELIANDRN